LSQEEGDARALNLSNKASRKTIDLFDKATDETTTLADHNRRQKVAAGKESNTVNDAFDASERRSATDPPTRSSTTLTHDSGIVSDRHKGGLLDRQPI
tara:strand:+ start:637 stop:930 length:294 start_codon:yes stop_codon:yes gene_type:complete